MLIQMELGCTEGSKAVLQTKKKGYFPCSLLLSLPALVSTGWFLSAEEGGGEKGGQREEEPAKPKHLWRSFALKNQPLLSDKLLRHRPKSAAGNYFSSVCSSLLGGDKYRFFLFTVNCNHMWAANGREKSVWFFSQASPCSLVTFFFCLPVHFHGTFLRAHSSDCSSRSLEDICESAIRILLTLVAN